MHWNLIWKSLGFVPFSGQSDPFCSQNLPSLMSTKRRLIVQQNALPDFFIYVFSFFSRFIYVHVLLLCDVFERHSSCWLTLLCGDDFVQFLRSILLHPDTGTFIMNNDYKNWTKRSQYIFMVRWITHDCYPYSQLTTRSFCNITQHTGVYQLQNYGEHTLQLTLKWMILEYFKCNVMSTT